MRKDLITIFLSLTAWVFSTLCFIEILFLQYFVQTFIQRIALSVFAIVVLCAPIIFIVSQRLNNGYVIERKAPSLLRTIFWLFVIFFTTSIFSYTPGGGFFMWYIVLSVFGYIFFLGNITGLKRKADTEEGLKELEEKIERFASKE